MRYKKQIVLAAIKNSNGIVSNVAEQLKCGWHTAKRYIEKWNDTKEAFEAESESLIDLAEKKLIEKLEDGSEQMIKYYLSTIGKKRGYSEKQEIDLTGDLIIKIDEV